MKFDIDAVDGPAPTIVKPIIGIRAALPQVSKLEFLRVHFGFVYLLECDFRAPSEQTVGLRFGLRDGDNDRRFRQEQDQGLREPGLDLDWLPLPKLDLCRLLWRPREGECLSRRGLTLGVRGEVSARDPKGKSL